MKTRAKSAAQGTRPLGESCVVVREGGGEALTGACAGTVLSREIHQSRVPTLFRNAEGNTVYAASARRTPTRRGRRPVARIEPFCARTGRSHVRLSEMDRQAASGRPKATIR